jgi:MerR family transcriptional regulator, thiopeptide resistance regulator
MAKPKSERALRAAECARRTGLTVRALRLYERLGLIKPARSASGWRLYGRRELVRLNAIVALKSLGLALAHIAEVLSSSALELRRVLHVQQELLQKRRAAADEGLKLVRAALASLDVRENLAIEDLCQLARSMDMGNAQQLTREVINESIGAEEERAWMTWWAKRPEGEAQSMQQYALAQRALIAELAKLQASGAEVASREVQRLADQWTANLGQYRVRQHLLEAITWNAALTRKWLDVGERITARALGYKSTDFWLFLRSALKAGPLGRALDTLLGDARSLVNAKIPPMSPQAAALLERLDDLCRQYDLGDPDIYARWTHAMGTISDRGERAGLDPADLEAWGYLVEARAAAKSR